MIYFGCLKSSEQQEAAGWTSDAVTLRTLTTICSYFSAYCLRLWIIHYSHNKAAWTSCNPFISVFMGYQYRCYTAILDMYLIIVHQLNLFSIQEILDWYLVDFSLENQVKQHFYTAAHAFILKISWLSHWMNIALSTLKILDVATKVKQSADMLHYIWLHTCNITLYFFTFLIWENRPVCSLSAQSFVDFQLCAFSGREDFTADTVRKL